MLVAFTFPNKPRISESTKSSFWIGRLIVKIPFFWMASSKKKAGNCFKMSHSMKTHQKLVFGHAKHTWHFDTLFNQRRIHKNFYLLQEKKNERNPKRFQLQKRKVMQPLGLCFRPLWMRRGVQLTSTIMVLTPIVFGVLKLNYGNLWQYLTGSLGEMVLR